MKLLTAAGASALLLAVTAQAAAAASTNPAAPASFLPRRGGATADAITQRRGGFKMPGKAPAKVS